MTESRTPFEAIWTDWIALWNGDFDRAKKIVADDYIIHMTPVDGSDLSTYAGPDGLAAWIKQLHMLFSPMTFTVQVPPLFQDDMIAGRWFTTGTYAGGLTGARAEPGTRVSFAGADFLRVRDGKIVEYWLSSDILDMMAQLKMLG